MKKTGRYKNLFSNMALFTIGNFVSKLLVMLLVPFYTNILTTGEYGIADGMQATLLLLVPLLTINIGEASLRYGIEKNKGRGSILRILLKYVGIADAIVAGVCVLIFALCMKERTIGVYALLFALLFICNSLYESVILYCQGCEKVNIMVTGSISCTVLVIASNLVFLLALRAGLYGYLFAQMISFAGASAIMLIFMIRDEGVWSDVSKDALLEKEMTGYGRSMLLYSTSSWINNALDRYFVLGMCGAAANGLYGVAYKIPAILTVFQRIFAQAWQISANKSYEDEDHSAFFSQVYKGYQTVMVIGCGGLIFLVRIVAYLLFAKDFYEAWRMVPPLLISVVFGALTGFLGSICLAFKDGKSMGRATGAGAIVNIVLNYFGIRAFGAIGAAYATMISYFTMYMLSYHMTAKHVQLEVSRGRDFASYIILLIEAFAVIGEVPCTYAVSGACLAVILIIYGRDFVKIAAGRLGKKI